MVDVELLDRRAAADEGIVARVTRVINEAYALGEAGLWVDGATRTSPPRVAELIEDGGMLAARAGSEIVGCANLRRIDDGTAELGLLSAAPERMGSGIGRRLLGFAETLMRARGFVTLQMELLVPRAGVHPRKALLSDWYQRLGYRIVGAAPFEEIAEHGADQLATPCQFLVFQKSLA